MELKPVDKIPAYTHPKDECGKLLNAFLSSDVTTVEIVRNSEKDSNYFGWQSRICVYAKRHDLPVRCARRRGTLYLMRTDR